MWAVALNAALKSEDADGGFFIRHGLLMHRQQVAPAPEAVR
jgi:hypothetical protein